MKYLPLLLFMSCNTDSGGVVSDSTVSDTKRKQVVIYDTVYRTIKKDSIVYKAVIKNVPIPIFIPAGLEDKIKNGTIKYTIDYK